MRVCEKSWGLPMGILWLWIVSSAPLFSQPAPPDAGSDDPAVQPMPEMPRGYFFGEVVRSNGTPTAGTLTAKQTTGELFECAYDAKSLFQLRGQRVKVTELIPGDPIRVLVDRRPGSRSSCYVRILDVASPDEEKPKSLAPTRTTQSVPPISDAVPGPIGSARVRTPQRASDNIAGVVVRLEGSLITVRTRDGDRDIRLRRDTRFFANGLKTEESALALNLRVAIAAGKNLDGDWEAFQISWGGISTVR